MKKVGILFGSFIIIIGLIAPILADTLTTTSIATPEVEYGQMINFDKANDGVVSAFYNNAVEKRMKLVIQLGDQREVYNLFNASEYVNYPLQLGNGLYIISIYENTIGTKYRKILSDTARVNIVDSKSIFLQSILEINWDREDKSIQLADELVAQALEVKKSKEAIANRAAVTLTESEIINKLYTYVIYSIQYDYEKINGLDYTYVPNNDKTLEVKTGICYDYSSLLASMLRSQGIPTKMVKGYASESSVYHAWNEIYLRNEERWAVVDSTADAYRAQKGYKYSFEKDPTTYSKIKEL